MAIEVKVNCSFAKEIEAVTRLEEPLKRALLLEAGKIKIRTQSGRGVDGGALKPYSKEYKKRLIKKTGSAKVDLLVTGAMQRAIETTVHREEPGVLTGEIFFNSAQEAVKAKYNQETREFFGLDQAQVDRIQKAVNSSIKI